MSINDETARAHGAEDASGAAGAKQDDIHSVLRLIAAQIEDADRRQSQLVSQLGERLDELESAAGVRGAQSAPIGEDSQPLQEESAQEIPAQEIPAQDAAGQDAAFGTFTSPDNADAMHADAPTQPTQPTQSAHDDFDAPLDAVFAALQASENPSSQSPEEQEPIDAFDADQLDLSADNLADLGPHDPNAQDAHDASEVPPAAALAFDAPGALGLTDNPRDPVAAADNEHLTEFEPMHLDAAPQASIDPVEPTPAVAAAAEISEETTAGEAGPSVAGNADEPWNTDDAEKLMSVYDEDVFTPHEEADPQPAAQPSPIDNLEVPPSDEPSFDGSLEAGFSTPETNAQPQDAALQLLDTPETSADAPVMDGNIETASIERVWLEDRFAEIAVLIEQTMSQMRDNDPVHALKDRFEKIQDDLTDAVDVLPSQKDFESLKSLETEIEHLREHFENVQSQLARLDSIEEQLQSVVERLSNDGLQAAFAAQPAGSTDPAELAAIVGEYVANRVSDKQAGAPTTDADVMRLEETLARFIEEQRAGNASQIAVLDTLQDAMVQMLDRVDGIPTAQYATAPSAHQPQPEAFQDATQHASMPHDDQYGTGLEVQPQHEGAPYEPAAGDLNDGFENQHAAAEEQMPPSPADDLDEELDRVATNASATQAAELAARRHTGFEPFSNDVVVSDGSDGGVPKLIVDPTQPQPAFEKTVGMKMPRAGNAQAALPQEHQQPEIAQEPASAPAHEPAVIEDGVSPVSRLRQEFIEEARRAKIQAEKDAVEAARLAVAEEAQQGAQKGAGGISLFGYTIGGSKKPAAAERVEAIANERPAAPVYDDAPVEPKIFGMSRKKVLLAACGLMIAASGLLLLSPRSNQTQQSPAVSGPVIERVMPENMSTGPVPQGAMAPAATAPQNGFEGPEAAAPEAGASDAQLQAPPARPAAPYDGKFDRGDANTPDIKGTGDRSDYYDPQAARTSRLDAPGRPAVAYLDGVALQTPTRSATIQELAHSDEAQSMAQWSLRLGDAASQRTTAELLPEYQASAAAPVQLTALAAEQPQAPSATRSTAERRSQLDLPPATVGPLSLRLAAAKGDPSAQFEVAARLAAGRGTRQDLKKAVTWYTRSASQGFAQSQYRLGTFFERGLGTKKDNARARIWYRRAAEQGNVKAMHNLAVLSAGVTSKKSDYATAATWFSKAASYGLADSQFNLAVLKENGLGVKKDTKAAYQYYTLAARAGDKDAKKRLAALAATMSASEIAAAESLVKSWRSKRPSKLVNDPIAAGQAWKKSTSLGR